MDNPVSASAAIPILGLPDAVDANQDSKLKSKAEFDAELIHLLG